MKGVGFCIIGFEDVCAKELTSLGAKILKKDQGRVIFEVKDYLDLAKISYLAKTTSRILYFLTHSKVTKNIDKKTIKKSLKDVNLKEWFDKDTTFKVQCKRQGNHNFTSSDFEKELGAAIINKQKQTVNLDSPDVIIFCKIINYDCLIGIDFCGFNTSKRDYHIFTNRTALRGNVGASLVQYADIKNKQTLLNPLCGSGTLAIESAFFNNELSPHKFRIHEFIFRNLKPLKNTDFDKFFKQINEKEKTKNIKIIAIDPLLSNTKSTQKNAKIASVQKNIECSKIDFEWFDTKYKEKSIDVIISRFPSESKNHPKKDIEKIYKEFFYQADYILNNKGKIVILLQNTELLVKIGKDYKFKVINELNIMIGKQEVMVITLVKR